VQADLFTLPRLPVLDVRRLAADFSAEVRASHTAAQLSRIRSDNAAETDPAIDHAFDYVEDAHDLMARAVSRQLGKGWEWPDLDREINSAWVKAKASGYSLMRVLAACEFSGVVRDAFAAQGHAALSCDLLPTEAPGPHYCGDVRDLLADGWHLMAASPDCTYLCSSGLHWNKRRPGREAKTTQALRFVRELLQAPVERISLENPPGRIGTAIRPADQYIQPNEYGHDASKKTGLWLKHLPKLIPTEHVAPRIVDGKPRWANQTDSGQNRLGPSPDRWQQRARFYSGVAQAMAQQWTPINGA